MNTKILIQGLALTTLLVTPHLAGAATIFNLCTGVTTKTMPDATIITMWGYGLDPTGTGACTATVPGPQLDVPDGDNIFTIKLRNTLTEPTSIMIAGLSSTAPAPVYLPADLQGRTRARSMTHEAPTDGTITDYNFTAAPGTYLYQSGSHPAVQVQMGLYGGVTKNTPTGNAYPMVSYDNEVILLYSEIDSGLHAAVASGSYGTAPYKTTINYVPKYFLVNGTPFVGGATADIPGGVAGETTLIRFLNAGLETHVPVLHGGIMDLIAEYGSPYPYSRKQYSLELAAGQSRDALFTPDSAGRYAIYDRSLRLTNNTDPNGGLMSFLNVVATGSPPVALADVATTDENMTIPAIDLDANDTDSDGTVIPDSIHIAFQPVNGMVVINNNGTGTVAYTPNTNFNGTDAFSYTIRDNLGNISNSADVTITVNAVNDAPVAINETYTMDAIANPTLSITTPGVLGNDTDIELDALTAILQTDVTGGNLILNPDGSFDYTPNPETVTDTFTYVAFDGTSNSNVSTVTITVISPTVVTLTSPIGNVAGINPEPAYTWEAQTSATDYRILVIDMASNYQVNNTHSASSVCNAATCSTTPNVPLADGSYWWGIQAQNSLGVSPWAFEKITVGTGIAPVAAVLTSPTGNVGVNLTPTYTWEAVTDATEYRLLVIDAGNYVIDEINPTSSACVGMVCSVTPTTALSSGGTYWWGIRAQNASGVSPWAFLQITTQ